LIAGINYVNLATAKASVRAKEIGVRKVTGALRSSLIAQFLVESVITCLLAAARRHFRSIIIACCQCINLKQLTVIGNPGVLGYMLVGVLLLGIIAGFFPAIYLSSFKPIAVLKGLKISEKGTLSLRKTLVVVTIHYFHCTYYWRIDHLTANALPAICQIGIKQRTSDVVKNAGAMSAADRNAFQNTVLQDQEVKKIATSDGVVGGLNWTNSMSVKGSQNSQLVNFSKCEL
jgi:putative ABC transport system permease protein